MGSKIAGVLNITTDSFSDGGTYLSPQAALARAHAMLDEGAGVIDIGAIASNPDAAPVSVAEEICRLDPVITALQASGAAVSIDSFRPETQRYALARGVDFLNDIHGFPHAAMYEPIACAGCRLILMHSIHGPARVSRADLAEADIVGRVMDFFAARVERLVAAGIDRGRIILDPGMGYFLGASPAASFAVLAALPRIRAAFGLPVMVGVSRKSFLRAATGRATPAETGPATLAAELHAALAGADYIRTHDVAALADGLRVLAAIRDAST